MKLEEKVLDLEKKMKKLSLRLNHATHPPHINQMLDYIRQTQVCDIEDLRQKFSLYGGNLTRLYNTLREKNTEFIYVPGVGRKAKMIIAHLNDGEPTTANTKAVHLFANTKIKGLITIRKIKSKYQITKEEAQQIYDLIIQLFQPRLDYPKRKADLYKTPLRRRY